MFQNPNDETIAKILEDAKTIAVVGLSDKPERDSYRVAEYLQRHGYRIIPVNPSIDTVLGQKSVPSLRDLDDPVDIIDVFRRSDALPAVVDESLTLSAPVIWAQLGIINEDAAQTATENGKTMIMDRCIKIEHSRLLRS
ncbi:CoA-binding protein [Alicyclobacillus dauci]|uniref:CoA-binding protein n=1 Tax=Alicyclobacillus dauci TaxID=1475485 RepID=A0ABY6YZ74_9BACL|nr:CoA-binding protein [Alicyclobacillus dauci]WAH35568.1 CoA-binding protein [Alicyclobacillus dauci]